jgi:hypothetical protein
MSMAILVATGPVIYMTHHSFKHGHVESARDHAQRPMAANPLEFGWTVCSECKAVVVDSVEHLLAAHQLADA